MDEAAYKAQMAQIEMEYNKAYYRWMFCPESEVEEAKRMLDIWRHKYFTFWYELPALWSQPKTPIILPNVGDTIRWFGTIYTVDAIKAPDVVVVTMGNGIQLPLWWHGGPGNTILK